jgi:hydroxyacylglutathione hydrolase
MSDPLKNACVLSPEGVPEINPPEVLKTQSTTVLIDVRRPDEWTGELGHIDGAQMVTLETDLDAFLPKLPKDKTYVFICRSGGRSGVATQKAQSLGFQSVYNMKGGMLAWNAHGFEVKR